MHTCMHRGISTYGAFIFFKCFLYYKNYIVYYTCNKNERVRFEAWAKLAQQWLVYAPLEIHLEPINKELMLLVTI